jgi:hypothetical protein
MRFRMRIKPSIWIQSPFDVPLRCIKGETAASCHTCRQMTNPCSCCARHSLTLSGCLILCLSGPLSAAIPLEDQPIQEEDQLSRVVDAPHAAMSNVLESALRRVDGLFSGNRNYDARTGSYVDIGLRGIMYRSGDETNALSLISRVKINLPMTNDKLQVVLARDIANVIVSESQRDAEVAAGQIPADNNPYLGLRALMVDTLSLHLSATAGLRVRNGPDPFARLRVERIFSAGDWRIPLSETLLWRRSEETSATTQVGFLRPAGKDSFVSFYSTATWRQVTGSFDLGQFLTYTHKIDLRSLYSGEIGVLGQTDPYTRATAYSIALRYRRQIHRDWLLFEVRPQLVYPRDHDFRPIPSLTLQLEMYLGQGYFNSLE